jgi:hypothetical protein
MFEKCVWAKSFVLSFRDRNYTKISKLNLTNTFNKN